ncbi:Uncharacterised protein [Mycobacteroides abscessus subsp. abscessus]|nr:Uncharacterised protein [Mycobacteroides abscessus subsp. abscessus]
MCDPGGITGMPNLSVTVKSASSNSLVPLSGAPLDNVRPMVSSRPERSSSSQVSISMRMRRSTNEVPPASHG